MNDATIRQTQEILALSIESTPQGDEKRDVEHRPPRSLRNTSEQLVDRSV